MTSELSRAIQTIHPGIADDLEGAINTLRKLQKIAGPIQLDELIGKKVAPPAKPDPPKPESPKAPKPEATIETSTDDTEGTVISTMVGQSPVVDLEGTMIGTPIDESSSAIDVEGTMLSDPGDIPSEAAPYRKASTPSLAVGDSFGRYQISRQLGEGAMGAVYLAYDGQLERHVALKIPFFGEKPDTIRRFYREARATAKIRNPNICPIFDVDQIGGIHYISMAFIEGQPLSNTISDGILKERDYAQIVQKLASGLQKAHQLEIIHRDLKPDNIMMDADGEPIVMDFGLARQINEESQVTSAGTLLGTPAYMSPEQVEGDQSALGPATDIYSLGVILYVILTGRLPFQGSIIKIIGQITRDKPPLPSEANPDASVNSQLEAICMQMMAKSLDDRFSSMTEVAAALDEFLRDDGTRGKTAKGSFWKRLFGG